MKKINIVKSNQEFNAIMKTGLCFKNLYFVIYSKNNSLGRTRFGISVGKKVGSAVVRNRLKRQLRSIIDHHKNLYSKSKDYIIIVRKSSLLESYQTLEENFKKLFKKIEKEKSHEK